MSAIPDAAVTAAADAILSAQNANDDEPERWETRHQATAALTAAQPHLAYAAGKAAGDRIAALEQLAADMLGRFTKGDAGYRARVGQVQIRRWQEALNGGPL